MSIKFDTTDYVFSHEKEPRGRGKWAFENELGEVVWINDFFSVAKYTVIRKGMTGTVKVLP